MNKTELIEKIAAGSGLKKAEAKDALDATLRELKNALVAGEKVQLVGFGTFEVKERAAHQGINPSTKEPMQIPASKSPVFKSGKQLKDAVNK